MEQTRESTSRLMQLRKLTEGLVRFNDIVTSCPLTEAFPVVPGKGALYGLFHSDSVGIVIAALPAGYVMELHYHEQLEWFGVIEGKVRLFNDKEERELSWVVLEKNEPHGIACETDSWLWAITQPASKSFPKAGERAEFTLHEWSGGK